MRLGPQGWAVECWGEQRGWMPVFLPRVARAVHSVPASPCPHLTLHVSCRPRTWITTNGR